MFDSSSLIEMIEKTMGYIFIYLQLRPIPGPNIDAAAAEAATDAAER